MRETDLHKKDDSQDRLSCARTARWYGLCAWLLVVIAFVLRTRGLTHDFDLGKVYHPDTPKQVWAAREFSKGQFFRKTGNPDYDGYPFFSSLVAAGIYRVVEPLAENIRYHLGLRSQPEDLPGEPRTIEWIMRLVNVVASSVSVWFLFCVARWLCPAPMALLVAAFFCFSPLDVVACRYASGESLAAFFGLLSLLFSVRIAERGGLFDYVAAAVFCTCSFSAKYHGGLLAFPLVTAHITRFRSLRALFGAESLRRAFLVLVTVAVVFVLTNPAVLVRPPEAVAQIFHFVFRAGHRGLRGAKKVSWTPVIWLSKFTTNAPAFSEAISPVLLAFACLGVVKSFLRWDRTRVVLSVLPLGYALFGLSRKTAENPVYSTLVTPVLFLLGILVISDFARIRVWSPLPRLTAWGLLVAAGIFLVNTTWREIFFFWHRDTRILAGNWVRENTPVTFKVGGGYYAFTDVDLVARQEPFSGLVFLKASPRDRVAEDFFLIKRIWLEPNGLTLFRNFPVSIFVSSPWIRQDWHLPVFQKVPSRYETELILADDGGFLRSGQVLHVESGKPIEKTFFSEEAVDEIGLRVRNGPSPTWCEIELAGQRLQWYLEPDQERWALVTCPRVKLPLLKKGKLYGCRIVATGGDCQVELAFHAEQKGMLLFSAGAYRDAFPFLRRAAEQQGNPTTSALAEIAAPLGGFGSFLSPATNSLASYARCPLTPEEIQRIYGLAVSYLDGLPYLEWTAPRLEYEGYVLVESLSPKERELRPSRKPMDVRIVRTPLFCLERGCYSLAITWRAGDGGKDTVPVVLKFRDGAGSEFLADQTVWLQPSPTAMVCTATVNFAKPSTPRWMQICLVVPGAAEIGIGKLTLKPNVTGTLNSLARALGAIARKEDPHVAASPDNYELLIAAGQTCAEKKEFDRAAGFFLAAADACPQRIAPAEALSKLPLEQATDVNSLKIAELVGRYRQIADERREVPVGAVFGPGIELRSFVLGTRRVKPGEEICLKLFWNVTKLRADRERYAVWVHFVDESGRIAFQGDHNLTDSLRNSSTGFGFGADGFFRIPVPREIRPGRYKIRAGVWMPEFEKQLRVKTSRVPPIGNGIELGTVEIEPGG